MPTNPEDDADQDYQGPRTPEPPKSLTPEQEKQRRQYYDETQESERNPQIPSEFDQDENMPLIVETPKRPTYLDERLHPESKKDKRRTFP